MLWFILLSVKLFSFSDSKFKNIQPESRSQLLSDESTVIFNENMDVGSDKSSERTSLCGSNSNVSVVTNDVEDSSNRTTKNNIFHEYVATETTVINTTCDIISRSAIRGKKNTTFLHHSNSAGVMTDDTDKSRVIVQMLSSDTRKSVKLQNIIENKSTNAENQSTHSFRDDVFKILSKSQSSNINVVNNNGKDRKSNEKAAPYTKAQDCRKVHTSQMFIHEDKVISDIALNVLDKSQVVSSLINDSSKIERKRRKRCLKSYCSGNGPKIRDNEYVSTYLQTATPNALRIVHYVLFDKYSPTSSKLQILETKKHILDFTGYPFKKNSQEYIKRTNCLHKIPRPILYEVHETIFGKTCLKNRQLMVQQLMEFFLKPNRYNKIVKRMKQYMEFLIEKECNKEYSILKERATKGPLPSVHLQKLTMMDVERIKNEIKLESIQLNAQKQHHKVQVEDEKVNQKDDGSKSNYSLPAYILKGPGKKLQYFPSIVKNVKKANEKDVSLLHYILYGRTETESVEVCRRNILEFSGFLECQTEFIAERKTTLLRLDQIDLFELCKILCLQSLTNSRTCRIKKIMEYLMAPFNPLKTKKKQLSLRRHSSLTGSKYSISESSEPKKNCKERQLAFQRHSSLTGSTLFMSEPNEPRGRKHSEISVSGSSKKVIDEGWRLRDIKTICCNIECSAPSDLAELNDLLFVKPCDETEIHEKILNFTRFSFPDNSIQYHYRKNLLFYMGPCLVRKIAKLLDFENWDVEPSRENLSSSILKFLMKKKGVDSPSAKPSLSTHPFPSFISTFNEEPKDEENILHPVTLQNEKKKASACDNERVFIHRVSKSYEKNESNSSDKSCMLSSDNTSITSDDKSLITSSCINERNGIMSDVRKEDSIPLRVFIHHPTDQELKHVIHCIIKDDLWHFTLGDLVQKVYDQYPQFNLLYRESFIKTEARQILSELRSNAFNLVQHMTLTELSM